MLNLQTFFKTKTEKLKNQQREYEAQQQYREHLQVCKMDGVREVWEFFWIAICKDLWKQHR